VASRYVGTLLQSEGVTLNDLFGARTVLEPPLAGLAARNATKAGVKRLRDVLVAEEAAVNDGPAFARVSTQFHQELVQMAGNQTLTVLASLLWDLVERHVLGAVLEAGDTPARVKQRTMAMHAHQRLVEFIAAKDAAGAEQFWQKHMAAVGTIMSEFHGSKALVDLFS
jgi:DNA-binding FadR family transcriptional regulator